MKDKIFKLFKDNYQMIISVGTVSLTIVYATICYFVYIYNRGQVDALHIDPHLIKMVVSKINILIQIQLP